MTYRTCREQRLRPLNRLPTYVQQLIKDDRVPASSLRCEPASTKASAIGRSWFSNVLAANHLCTYAHQTKLWKFALPK